MNKNNVIKKLGVAAIAAAVATTSIPATVVEAASVQTADQATPKKETPKKSSSAKKTTKKKAATKKATAKAKAVTKKSALDKVEKLQDAKSKKTKTTKPSTAKVTEDAPKADGSSPKRETVKKKVGISTMSTFSRSGYDISANVTATMFTAGMYGAYNLGNYFDNFNQDNQYIAYDPNDDRTKPEKGGCSGSKYGNWGYGDRNLTEIETLFKNIENANGSTPTVRIPVTFTNHICYTNNSARNSDLKYVIDSNYLNAIANVVDIALRNGHNVVLCMMHDMGNDPNKTYRFQPKDNEEEALRYIHDIWAQVSDKFANTDYRLAFEGYNEPTSKDMNRYNSSDWTVCRDSRIIHDYAQAFIDTVRSRGGNNYNAKRVLLVQPGNAADVMNGGPLASFIRGGKNSDAILNQFRDKYINGNNSNTAPITLSHLTEEWNELGSTPITDSAQDRLALAGHLYLGDTNAERTNRFSDQATYWEGYGVKFFGAKSLGRSDAIAYYGRKWPVVFTEFGTQNKSGWNYDDLRNAGQLLSDTLAANDIDYSVMWWNDQGSYRLTKLWDSNDWISLGYRFGWISSRRKHYEPMNFPFRSGVTIYHLGS